MDTKEMVFSFQCPGCVCGSNPECGNYNVADSKNPTCAGWVPGTMILPTVGKIALGLPKGFNRIGGGELHIRLYGKDDATRPVWDKFNVPVWAMVEKGFLYVRTYSPRINKTWLDVVEGGTFALFVLFGRPIDVGAFINDID